MQFHLFLTKWTFNLLLAAPPKMSLDELLIFHFIIAVWTLNRQVVNDSPSSKALRGHGQQILLANRAASILSIIQVIEAVSAELVPLHADNHRKLIKISANGAYQAQILEVFHELPVLVAVDVQHKQVFQSLLLRVKIDFRAFFQLFQETLATNIIFLLIAPFTCIDLLLL